MTLPVNPASAHICRASLRSSPISCGATAMQGAGVGGDVGVGSSGGVGVGSGVGARVGAGVAGGAGVGPGS